MATIKDVAKLAGVSVSTVSRALSEKIFVDPDTKSRVLQAVDQLHYRPNLLAKGLKEGKTNSLGLLIPDITNIYYSRVIRSVEKYAAQRGYSLLLHNSNDDLLREQNAVETLKNRSVDGMIALPVSADIRHILSLRDEHIPFVVVNRWFPDEINCVSNDQRGGAYDVMKYLIERGHRKISVVLRGFNQTIYQDRFEGCLDALREYGLLESEKYFLFNVNSIDDARRRVADLLSKEDKPSVFFVTSDMLVFGIYSAIGGMEMRIPQDVSVVGFDNLPTSPYMIPPLTTYEQALDDIGEEAIKNLVRQIEGTQAHPEKLFMRGTMITRDSVNTISAE